jgi:hypothetical protein
MLHGDLNLVSRLLLGQGRQEEQAANDDDQGDDERDKAGHGGAFAERESRCIAPSRD